jgi:hypothetical protein
MAVRPLGTTAQCNAGKLINRETRLSEDVAIHYGLVASGDQVMRDGDTRGWLRQELDGQLSMSCIRGICGYADLHKNNLWQPYAAATASAYAKELLSVIPAHQVIGAQTAASAATAAGK